MKNQHSFWEKRIEKRIERGVHKSIFVFVHFLFGAAFLAVLGYVVMALWNWLVPVVMGWQAINYWQALGLFALCKLLFGSFGGKHWFGKRHHHRHDNPMRDKWLKMTPEERKEFINKMHNHRCGHDFFQPTETENHEESAAK